MSAKFDCPECGRAMLLPDAPGGTLFRCPYCKQMISTPHPEVCETDEDVPEAKLLPDEGISPSRRQPVPEARHAPSSRREPTRRESAPPQGRRRSPRRDDERAPQSGSLLPLLLIGGGVGLLAVVLVGGLVTWAALRPAQRQPLVVRNDLGPQPPPPIVLNPPVGMPEPPPGLGPGPGPGPNQFPEVEPPIFDPPKNKRPPRPRPNPEDFDRPHEREPQQDAPKKVELLPLDDADAVQREGKLTGKALAGRVITKGDLTLTKVELTKVPRNPVVWADDGKAFYCIDGSNTLRRVSVPDLKEEWALELKRPAASLTESSEGLVAVLAGGLELRVIDPKTRTVKKRLVGGLYQEVASSRGTPLAVAVTDNWGKLALYDLAAGTVQATNGEARHPAVSPDGKYLYGQGGIESLQKYKLEKSGLTPEGSSKRIASNGQCVVVSPDGKHACLPAGGGNGPGYSTYVYRTDNLATPSFILESGAYPRTVGFDPKNKRVFAQNHDEAVQVYDYQGVRKATYKVPEWRGDVRAFFVSPAGGSMLIQVMSHGNAAHDGLWLAQLKD